MRTVQQLYPQSQDQAPRQPLRGLYLAHALHKLGRPGAPFIYGNFVSSLDGRIGLLNPATGQSVLPEEITSQSDLRLLLELHAQADCLITNAGYLRAVADGRLDDILQVGTVRGHEDLVEWRAAQGLAPQPVLCIASASLDFIVPASVARHRQHILIATGALADTTKRRRWEDAGYEVITAGEAAVRGGPLAQALSQRGLHSAFLLAGPRMLEAMLRDRALSRLYLTLAHRVLGGERFHSMIEGASLGPLGILKLAALYLDAPSSNGSGQFFAVFEPHPSA